MQRRKALRVPGRPLVWIALALAVFSAALSLFRLTHLPAAEVGGVCSAVVREAEGDTYLLSDLKWIDGSDRAPPSGRVLLEAEPYAYPLLPGQRITAEVTLYPLQMPSNPHGWDERLRFILSEAVYTGAGRILSHSGEAALSRAGRLSRADRRDVGRGEPAGDGSAPGAPGCAAG